MLAKAATLPADEIVIDLEDAVEPAQKTDETRALAAQAVLDSRWMARTVAVRVNGVETPWCFRDVTLLVERAGARVDCVVVPKVEDVSHVHFVAHLLAQLEAAHRLERRIGIEVLIETARGLREVERIATASDRLEALVFGPGDYSASLGMPQLVIGGIDEGTHYALSRVAVAARAAGLDAIDGPYAVIRDLDGFRESALRSALLGYDGKWVLHPDQIAPCNEIYTPSEEQYEEAERLLEAYGGATAGAILHDGHMVDEASRKLATRIVERRRAAFAERSA
jgi:citrate lyase subunit beta / citryl-CoA lyase